MSSITLEFPKVKDIITKVFPTYKGRKNPNLIICKPGYKIRINTTWEGGSRDSFALVRREDFRVYNFPADIGNPFTNPQDINFTLIPGTVLFQRTIFRGKELPIKVYCLENEVPPSLLPQDHEEVNLSVREYLVLSSKVWYKSSYAGKNRREMLNDDRPWNSRDTLTGVDPQEYSVIENKLKSLGLITKNNAISVAGKNLQTQLQTKYGRDARSAWTNAK